MPASSICRRATRGACTQESTVKPGPQTATRHVVAMTWYVMASQPYAAQGTRTGPPAEGRTLQDDAGPARMSHDFSMGATRVCVQEISERGVRRKLHILDTLPQCRCTWYSPIYGMLIDRVGIVYINKCKRRAPRETQSPAQKGGWFG